MELPNIIYLDQLCADDHDSKLKMIQIIKKELPIEINAFKTNLQLNNFELAANSVHKLQHKISILGLEKSYYIAIQFEHELKTGSNNLQNEFYKILTVMQDFVKCL